MTPKQYYELDKECTRVLHEVRTIRRTMWRLEHRYCGKYISTMPYDPKWHWQYRRNWEAHEHYKKQYFQFKKKYYSLCVELDRTPYNFENDRILKINY